jgi:quinol monooxygenase YgiN
MEKVMTIVEGAVGEDKWKLFVDSYLQEAQHKPEGLLQSYLSQNDKNPEEWTIMSVWSSAKALEKMRNKGTPKAITFFRNVGSEPKLMQFSIIAQL